MLPIATPPNAIAYGSGYIHSKEMLKVGSLLNIFGIVLLYFITRWWLPLVFSYLAGCAKIIQDEVGVKRTFGRLNKNTLSPGLRFFNPFASTIIKVPVRTINLQIEAGLPSKEGLTIKSEISILYSVKKEEVPKILETVGLDFQEVLILPVFRSASADVCARFFAKDMHSSERAKIEKEIKEKMMDVLSERGFNIEAVLMKSITLPPSLSKAIEDKLSAEQE
eukprot:gene13018-17323_t